MNNFIQKYYFFSFIVFTSLSTLSMNRILSLSNHTKLRISKPIVYCAAIDAAKKVRVLEDVKKMVDRMSHQYCLTTLPLELQYKIFNELPSQDKNVLMQTCWDFYRLGKISPENFRFFVFEPALVCSSKDLSKFANVEFATDDYHCAQSMIQQMNSKYAAYRQLHIVDLLKEEYQAVDNSINNGLNLFNLLKNCYRLNDHCTFLEIKALGNFSSAIYDQCRLEAAMDTHSLALVTAERDKARTIISLKQIKNCAGFRLVTFGTWFFFASLYGASAIIALAEKIKINNV